VFGLVIIVMAHEETSLVTVVGHTTEPGITFQATLPEEALSGHRHKYIKCTLLVSTLIALTLGIAMGALSPKPWSDNVVASAAARAMAPPQSSSDAPSPTTTTNHALPRASLPCVQAPACLEPSGQCLDGVAKSWPHAQCIPGRSKKRCGPLSSKRVYELPTTGLLLTLPVPSLSDMQVLYSETPPRRLVECKEPTKPRCARVKSQLGLVSKVAKNILGGRRGLTVLEVGCANGWLLYGFRKYAANGGRLLCIDQKNYSGTRPLLESAKKEVQGLSYTIRKEFFDEQFDVGPAGIDIFLSSHALEHVPDPCVWLRALHAKLNPGGIVFTEVPNQAHDPQQGQSRGTNHLSFWSPESFKRMVTGASNFRIAYLREVSHNIRSVLHRPA